MSGRAGWLVRPPLMDPYATHFPVVSAAAQWSRVVAPELPILELGCGDYSTPMLHAMRDGRDLHIVSSDEAWANKYATMVQSLTMLPSREDWPKWEPLQRYGMCLLDNEQLVKNRVQMIPRLIESCAIVVMHDWREGLSLDVNCLGDNWGIYKRWEPWTIWIQSPAFGHKKPFHI